MSQSVILSAPCGKWTSGNPGSFTTYSSTSSQANAVKVNSQMTLKAAFSKILKNSFLYLKATSIVLASNIYTQGCMKPFGIDWKLLTGVPVNSGASSEITVGTASPGNWGKVNPTGEISGGADFETAMTDNVCGDSVELNSDIDTITGAARVKNAFQAVSGEEMVFGAVCATNDTSCLAAAFSNGSGSVWIKEFIKVRVVRNQGSGSNWTGTFELIERDVTPPLGGTPTLVRKLAM